MGLSNIFWPKRPNHITNLNMENVSSKKKQDVQDIIVFQLFYTQPTLPTC